MTQASAAATLLLHGCDVVVQLMVRRAHRRGTFAHSLRERREIVGIQTVFLDQRVEGALPTETLENVG